MIKQLKLLLLTAFLVPFPSICYNQEVVTFISPRSQSFNAERMLAGWENSIHQPNRKHDLYGVFAFTAQATSSFRSERINQCLFGEDVIQCMPNNTEWNDFIVISGSQTKNRSPQKDWLADYFGLPTDFKSLVRFRPQVNNFIFDAHAFIGLNTILSGLFMRIELPLIYANWNLNMKENITEFGTNNYTAGYFNATGIERANLMPSFSQFIAGCATPDADNLIFKPLSYAKMSPCSKHLVRFAELTGTLGYDHYIGQYHHIGIALQAAAPCGNRPEARFLFEPMIGNGHHWELGGELSAHCRTWTNKTENNFTEFFFNATVTHLFKTKQKRSFDLKKLPNSRYMLAEKLLSESTNNLSGNGIPAQACYAQEVSSIANLTTFDVNVTINAQADIAFMYAYTSEYNTWSIGYSLYKRGCETIEIINCKNFPYNTWAIKGDAQVFGFIAESTSPHDIPVGTAIPLSATESKASINTGTNAPSKGASTPEAITAAQKNPHIDSPQLASAGNNQPLSASLQNLTLNNRINTSIQPHFISIEDIDINSAATSGFSQKFFTHFNHSINRYNEKKHSYIGIGAEIEFGRHAGPTPAIGADKCINSALSQWTAWIKTGTTW